MTRRPRYNPKPDDNHALVPQFIDAVGGTYRGFPLDCMDISKTGGRRVDWIIAVGPINVFVEIKTPEAYASQDCGLTEGEREFFATWPGRKAIVESYERLRSLIDCIADELEDA